MTRIPARILVVEDEWVLAEETATMLTEAGYTVAGPVPSVAAALALIETSAIDGAVLDVQLDRELSLPIAEALMARNVPFVFMSGYTTHDLPPRFRDHPLIRKPAAVDDLQTGLGRLVPPWREEVRATP